MGERDGGNKRQEVNLYGVVLTPKEADAYFKKAQEAVEAVRRSPYGNIVDRVRGRLGKDAHQKLADMVGILLPLSMQDCVQKGETSLATTEAIQTTIIDTMKYVASFRSSGVRILGPDEIVPTMTSMLKGL